MKNIKESVLIVIICFVLGLIVLPVFSVSRLLAEKELCLNRLMHIGNAIALYTNDYNGYYPLGRSHTSGTWQQVLTPYVEAGEVFFCPSSDRQPNYSMNVNENILKIGLNHNYSANFAVMGDFNDDITIKNYPARRFGDLKNPENLICVLDGSMYIFEPKLGLVTSKTMYIPGMGLAGVTCTFDDEFSKNDFYKGRHDQGVNILYADAHAGFMKSRAVFNMIKEGEGFLP